MAVIDVHAVIGKYVPITRIGDYEDVAAAVAKLTASDARRLCRAGVREFTHKVIDKGGIYTYVADSKMSGLPMYCGSPHCRIRNLHDIAGYTLLYADCTYVVNPFSYAVRFMSASGDLSKMFLEELSFAVFATLTLKPLLEYGLLRYTDYSPHNYCQKCMAKVLLGATSGVADRGLELAFEHFLQTTSCKVATYRKTKKRAVVINYDESHQVHRTFAAENASWLEQHKDGEILDRDTIIAHKLLFRQASLLTHDLFAKNIQADRANAKNVFANSFELKTVSNFAGVSASELDVVLEYPLLTAIQLSQALKIRESEWHHIHDFRSAIKELMGDPERLRLEGRQLAEVEMSKLHKILGKARRQATGELLEAVPLAGFSIVAAVATSGLSNVVAAAAAALGSGHAATKAIPAIRKEIAIPEDMRESRYYFAWRVGRVLSKH